MGEQEILRDQIIRFTKKVKESDVRNVVDLEIYKDMCHLFHIMPCLMRDRAIAKVSEFVLAQSQT